MEIYEQMKLNMYCNYIDRLYKEWNFHGELIEPETSHRKELEKIEQVKGSFVGKVLVNGSNFQTKGTYLWSNIDS